MYLLLQLLSSGLLLPLAISLASCYTIYIRFENEVQSLKQQYVLEERQKSIQHTLTVSNNLNSLYLGMRAIATLPDFQQSQSNKALQCTPRTEKAIQEILNRFSEDYNVKTIFVTPLEERNRGVNKFVKPKYYFENGLKPSSQSLKSYVQATYEQLDWLQQRFPFLQGVNQLNYPASISPAVSTIFQGGGTQRVSATTKQTGVVLSLPYYGHDGDIAGIVCCLIPESVFLKAIDSSSALLNQRNRSQFWRDMTVLNDNHSDFIKTGTPIPEHIYSEVTPINTIDQSGEWILWRTLEDSKFYDLSVYKDTVLRFIKTLLSALLATCVVIAVMQRMKNQEERKFQSLVRNSQEIILILNEEYEVEHVVGQTESQIGWKVTDLLNKNFSLLVKQESRPTYEALIHSVHTRAYLTDSAEIQVELSDGSNSWYEATASNMSHLPELKGIVITLSNIAARKQSEEMLLAAKESAESASEAKTQFLSRMSHEFRTPLNAILGFSQILEMSKLPPRDKESVEQILNAGRHLLGLVNDVLDISRIETHNLAMNLTVQCCQELIEEVSQLMKPMAESHQVTLNIEPSDKLSILADNRRVKQVLINLVSNAIKYNQLNGSVMLSAAKQGDRVRIQVEDTGIGIPLDIQHRLFIPFDRLEADKSQVEGVGLGLSLCKTLVEGMQGSISVQSIPGKGSLFTVELPFATPEMEQSLAPTMAETDEIVIPTVVYIEEKPQTSKPFRTLIRSHGMRIITAIHGSVGIEMATLYRPDLIVIDADISDTEPVTILKALRNNPQTKDGCIIFTSDKSNERERLRALLNGADFYVSKPHDEKEFNRILKSLLPEKDLDIHEVFADDTRQSSEELSCSELSSAEEPATKRRGEAA
jgi:PAS domain S-box-containing protein